MNAIKRIKIENFQSHAKTIIDFAGDGNLNVIIGPSDSGKTAMFRALRLVLYNIPQGADYIRAGCTFARVSVEFASGHTVIRERSVSKNQYKIIAPGADAPEIFEGFGNDVPFEITEITGVRPVTIGDLEINLNLAEQLDGPFLGKSVSGGTRAKVIGKLAGTERIDHAGKALGTDLYRRNQDEKRLQAELATLAADIARYDYLPVMAERIEALEHLTIGVRNTLVRLNEVLSLKERIRESNGQIEGCQAQIKRWQNIGLATSLAGKIDSAGECKTKLVSLASSLNAIAGGIVASQSAIRRWKHLDTAAGHVAKAELSHVRQQQIRDLGFKSAQVDSNILLARITLGKHGGVPAAEKCVTNLSNHVAKKTQLAVVRERLSQLSMVAAAVRAQLERCAALEKAGAVIARTDAAAAKVTNIRTIRFALAANTDQVEKYRGNIILHEQRVAELEGAYHDALAMAGVCPMCGNVINPKKSVQKAS